MNKKHQPSAISDHEAQQKTSLSRDSKTRKPPTSHSIHRYWVAAATAVKRFMKREDAAQWIMTALTLAIVLLTTITTHFTCRQISIYENTTRMDLRAYMIFKEIGGFSIRSGSTANYFVQFVNVGKTPAYNYIHISQIMTHPAADMDSVAVMATLFRHTKQGNVVGSNLSDVKYTDFRVNDIPVIITAEDSVRIATKALPIFVIGAVSYEDVFQQSHLTWYCVQFDPRRNMFIMQPRFNGAT